MSFELTHRQSAALVQDSAELLTWLRKLGSLACSSGAYKSEPYGYPPS